MAQNDYFVIVYQVLKYLYECLKKPIIFPKIIQCVVKPLASAMGI